MAEKWFWLSDVQKTDGREQMTEGREQRIEVIEFGSGNAEW